MPEILEVESYRRLAKRVLGRTITGVEVPDLQYVKRGLTPSELVDALVGCRITEVRRTGKVLLLDSNGPTLGLRFGMTGRLLVDDMASIDYLRWGSRRQDPAWVRFGLIFQDSGHLRIEDPRRLGGAELDLDERTLGPDAWAVPTSVVVRALTGGRGTLKGRLLDQSRLAGLGNLLVDEILWRAGLSPCRQAGSLDDQEVRLLGSAIRGTLTTLDKRGGSHTGDLVSVRIPGGSCPADGTLLERSVVGGRTTWWCPDHQR